jgi:hypothetical protein
MMAARMRACQLALSTLSAALLIACSRADAGRGPPASEFGYGSVMADVAHRFELLGRAAGSGRSELAQYELGEIAEQFEKKLPFAALPRDGHTDVLPKLGAEFLRTNVPDLRRALATHDRGQVADAFARTASACNECHEASGHGFIEVPLVAGRSVPNTDPVSP